MIPRALVIAALVPLVAACSGLPGGMTPSSTVTTAIEGWQQWLRVDWSAEARPPGQVIDGYVYSSYGSPVYDVQILAQALDAAGNVVGQKIVWVQGVVPPLQRTYFHVGAMPAADHYRVTVWAFETVQSLSYF